MTCDFSESKAVVQVDCHVKHLSGKQGPGEQKYSAQDDS